jgi:glycosyltransferase involved in cell wall biosynthesis
MIISVVIATYNRARDLRETLASLSRVVTPPDSELEFVIVDNNSSDSTREVVEQARESFPYELRYEFESEQGRSAALNRAFACARGDVIVTTDDDVRVPDDWIVEIDRAFKRHRCGYIGGRVLPLWGAPPPRWLAPTSGRMWAVIALLDFGPEPAVFRSRVPLGVNMALTREALERVGNFNARVGRKAGTLLGQEVREWGLRARAAGVDGVYVPEVVVHHIIPAERLRKAYFRRWFYWRGISRAMMYADTGRDMESPETSSIDFSTVAHLCGVPRYMFRSAFAAARDMLIAAVRRDPVTSFERELWLWFFAGILKQRWSDRRLPPRLAPVTSASSAAKG